MDELTQPWAGKKLIRSQGWKPAALYLRRCRAPIILRFCPDQEKGKLPFKTISTAYALEYGLDEMEMHEDAVQPGEKVILVDDLIATGGTAEGAIRLLKKWGPKLQRPVLLSICLT